MLSNIYVHYTLDLWVQQWRTRHAKGDVIIVRYADDSVMGSSTKEGCSASCKHCGSISPILACNCDPRRRG
ncbi:hypothetical protein ACXHXM_36805